MIRVDHFLRRIGALEDERDRLRSECQRRAEVCLEAIRKAVAEEREECAKICDAEAAEEQGKNANRHWQSVRIGHAIRARKP